MSVKGGSAMKGLGTTALNVHLNLLTHYKVVKMNCFHSPLYGRQALM